MFFPRCSPFDSRVYLKAGILSTSMDQGPPTEVHVCMPGCNMSVKFIKHRTSLGRRKTPQASEFYTSQTSTPQLSYTIICSSAWTLFKAGLSALFVRTSSAPMRDSQKRHFASGTIIGWQGTRNHVARQVVGTSRSTAAHTCTTCSGLLPSDKGHM